MELYLSLKKNLKVILNKVKISNILSFVMILSMILVLSLWSVGWDPNRIGWDIFLVNLSFLIFLGVYGLFFGETTGTSFFRTLVTGAYQASRELFLETVDMIIKAGFADVLPQYIPWRYQQDCESTYSMKLLSVKLFNKKIIDLPDEEIELLKKEAIEHVSDNGKVEYYSRLSQEQFQMVDDIRNGRIVIDYIDDYNFYLIDAPSHEGQIITKIKNTEQRKNKILWAQRISKLSMIVMCSLIGAGVSIDTMSGQNLSQTLVNLISRLTTLTTSVVCGFNTARILNLEDIEVFRYKTSYNKVFFSAIENNLFKPLDYEELAKQEYERQQEQKNERLEEQYGDTE